MGSRPAPRQLWLDVARGIGIVLVVHGHVVNGLADAGILQGAWVFTTFLVYCFHMPLFFVAAGITAAHSLNRGARAFLRPRLSTVVYPYFLWSTIQLLTKMALPEHVNHPVDWSTVVGIGIWPREQFWFLYALLICQVISAFVSRALLLPVAAALYLTSYFLPGGMGITAGAHFAIFFAVGVIFSARFATWNPGWSWFLCWIPFVVLGTFAWRTDPNYFSYSARAAGAFGIIGTFCVAKRLRDGAANVLAWLGKASMAIFVLHTFPASGIRIVLVKLGVFNSTLHYAAGVTAGLGFSIAAMMILARWGLLPWLGLAAFKKPAATARATS